MTTTPAKQCDQTATFYDGRPIDKFSDDRLGRKDFVRFFADAISRHEGKESLVLAINAPWGDGKTSFKNMAVDLLEQEYSKRIVALNFTPWEWASQNQLAAAFFSEIAKQLELKDHSSSAKKAAGRLRGLGTVLGLSKVAIPVLSPFAEFVLPGSTLIGAVLGKGLEKAEKVAKETAKDLQEAASDSRKSLAEVKTELRSALEEYVKNQHKLLLIIIDDIDRLQPEEIRLMFQLVKANGDFPGLVFLLLYEEQFVINALKNLFPNSEKRFLEKIVQFQIGLPALAENQIRDHTWNSLKKLLSSKPAYLAFASEQRFSNLWNIGLVYYLRNLRQAERLLNSFSFHVGAFRSNEAEVNPLDLFVLEAFRLFEPALYVRLRASAAKLLPRWDMTLSWGIKDDKDDPWKKLLDEFALEVAELNRAAARELLENLFPDRFVGWNTVIFDSRSSERAAQRRISHILYFHRYFRLAIDAEDIPDSRITDIEKKMDAPEQFVASLKQLNGERKLTLALTKLLSRPTIKVSERPAEFIAAILDLGDTLGDIQGPEYHVRVPSALQQLIELQIPAVLNHDDRYQRLSEGMTKSKSIHSAAQTANRQDHEEYSYSKADASERKKMTKPLTRLQVEGLNRLIRERIEEAVRKGQVQIDPSWVVTLRWYLEFQEEAARQNAPQLLKHPDCVATLLRAVINEQAFKQYEAGEAHFAKLTLFMVKTRFGYESFETALAQHESYLKNLGDSTEKWLVMYQDMRQRFSDLPELQDGSS